MSTRDPQGLSHADVSAILDVIDRSHFGELELQLDGMELYVRKTGEAPTIARREQGHETSAPQLQAPAEKMAPEPAPEAPAAAPEPSVGDEGAGLEYVKAPMVGTFYRAPGPDQPPFVEVGDQVGAGDEVCLIEVMKLFNSVTAGAAGRVAEILVENGAMVEFGQPLLAIESAGAT